VDWSCGDRGACYWGIACCKIPVDLRSDCLQLPLFKPSYADAAPALGGANERDIDELQDGPLAKGMRNDFGALTGFAEQSLEQVGGADGPGAGSADARCTLRGRR
jgi:hypothetical protein